MIRSIRAFFLSRALREKLLLLAFVGIGAVWWLSAFSTRAAAFVRASRNMSSQLAVQSQWITNRAVIEKRAEQTASRLDPARTLNSLQLVSTVSQLANEAGLKNARTSGNPSTNESGPLAVHTALYTIQNVEWEQSLQKFYAALEQRSPYIAIEQFILQAPPNNPGQLTLSLKVSSVEIRR
jgi:cytoskeletal protein RodZ